jgi:D-glycero-D-manno-heptose 1,7-bisphosphate phosphatase
MTPGTLDSVDRTTRPWCLFLDRDGVINRRILGGYVRDWSEFTFETGALEALAILARWAPHIVVVTNQQGVGKGIMSSSALAEIHERMRLSVAHAGGRIDAIQHCPHLASADCDCRKPNAGMAAQYLAAHHQLDASLSVMVGDTDSDIEMGRRLAGLTGGCVTVRIDKHPDPIADATYRSLAEFAAAIAPRLGATAAGG